MILIPNSSASSSSVGYSLSPVDNNGYCYVPLSLTSETDGTITLGKISVKYIKKQPVVELTDFVNTAMENHNEIIECNSENCCNMRIMVNSESEGILNLSNLRIIYKPTLCEKSNLDFLGTININDFATFAEEFSKNGEYLLGDINRNQIVDMEDISVFIVEWLNSCSCN